MTKIEVATFFDCTNTHVVNHRRYVNLDEEQWQFKRNQQRNWETLMQCISLRCQPMNITPIKHHQPKDSQHFWAFSFETDRESIFTTPDDPLGHLKDDCHGVPMLVGLDESEKELFLTPYLVTKGDSINTFFQVHSINN